MKPIKFPKDELSHKYIIEWWYWNGQLSDKNGNVYSFMSCFFKADTKKVKIPSLSKLPFKDVYFYHSIVTDIKKQRSFIIVEEVSSISNDSFKKPLLYISHTSPIALSGYINRLMESTSPFSYIVKDENIDLKLVSTKKPLLEGGKGYINVHSKESYYYSLTNLKTAGKLKIGNKWIDVTGKGWMDHQWANAPYTKDKWTWFSIQLNDNRELVCYKYNDGEVKTYLASLSEKNGKTEHFTNVKIEPLKIKWKSNKTKAIYPIEWNITIPEKNLKLHLTPLAKKQEMLFGSINYWEGPMLIKGNIGKKKVTGRGFLELVGYPSKYSNLNYAEDKIKKMAGDTFAFVKKNIL